VDSGGRRPVSADRDVLRRLAQEVEPLQDRRHKSWWVDGDTVYWQSFIDGKPTVVPQTFIRADIGGERRLRFVAAANPTVILDMLEEIELLRAMLKGEMNDHRAKAEAIRELLK